MELEERVESISSLPPEILRRIVSLIPLKEAVKTSILSTPWRSLWTPFLVDLEFDEDKEKLNQIRALLLKSCDSPELWKFFLGFNKRENEGLKINQDLIFSATKGAAVKELLLDFYGGKQMKSNFNLILQPSCPSSCRSNFSCLKTLHLRSINQLAENLVSALFFHCQLLESLKLEKCNGLQSINVKASNWLESFEMVDCPDIVSITVSAPNLESFRYRGFLPQIEVKSSPNLVDVVLDLREGLGDNEFDCEDVLSLLASLKDIEILMISGWLLEWLCTSGVIFERLQFQFNKLKELRWFDSSMNRAKINSLACFLNISPVLEKLFIKIDQNLSSITCPYFHQHWHEPHLWLDYEAVKANASQLEHLKIVKLVGFTNEDDQLLLMDLILKKAAGTLKSMTVISPEKQSWRVTKIPKSQLKHTCGCHTRRIVILSPNEDYFFGLTEENGSV